MKSPKLGTLELMFRNTTSDQCLSSVQVSWTSVQFGRRNRWDPHTDGQTRAEKGRILHSLCTVGWDSLWSPHRELPISFHQQWRQPCPGGSGRSAWDGNNLPLVGVCTVIQQGELRSFSKNSLRMMVPSGYSVRAVEVIHMSDFIFGVSGYNYTQSWNVSYNLLIFFVISSQRTFHFIPSTATSNLSRL